MERSADTIDLRLLHDDLNALHRAASWAYTQRALPSDSHGARQAPVVNTKDFENYKRTGVRAGNANIRALAAERRMQEITRQTGGAVYSPIDERELDQAFNQISAELSQQYILSYYPEDEANKRGEFRAISLSVKSNQNLTVRTRKGYYVPRLFAN